VGEGLTTALDFQNPHANNQLGQDAKMVLTLKMTLRPWRRLRHIHYSNNEVSKCFPQSLLLDADIRARIAIGLPCLILNLKFPKIRENFYSLKI
jgi:hypothetical protein